MNSPTENHEGILLRIRKSGEKGKLADIFTADKGRISVYIPKNVILKCGSGGMLPLTFLNLTVMKTGEYRVAVQYEGRSFFNILSLSYEEMQCWYYVIELTEELFPEEQGDFGAYQILNRGSSEAKERNKTVTALIVSIKLLAEAGFDPAAAETVKMAEISEAAKKLLHDFSVHDWKSGFDEAIKVKTFKEIARYIDTFITRYCDVELKTKGAFLQ